MITSLFFLDNPGVVSLAETAGTVAFYVCPFVYVAREEVKFDYDAINQEDEDEVFWKNPNVVT